MKILYIASPGPLSMIPLEQLLISSHQVCAIAFTAGSLKRGQDCRFPIVIGSLGTIESLALSNDIPMVRLQQDLSQNLVEIMQYEPDVILVSCFPRKLPNSILLVPTIGCFNLHPSLLPAYRGPVPIFWQFRAGEDDFGVTLHRMSSQLDAGNIIGQSAVTMPDGVTKQQANTLLAAAGYQLMTRALDDFERVNYKEIAQNERLANYQGFPSESDFAVSTQWTAKRIFNFIRATGEPGRVYPCNADGRVYPLVEAMAYQEIGSTRVVATGSTITLPCSHGSITARILSD